MDTMPWWAPHFQFSINKSNVMKENIRWISYEILLAPVRWYWYTSLLFIRIIYKKKINSLALKVRGKISGIFFWCSCVQYFHICHAEKKIIFVAIVVFRRICMHVSCGNFVRFRKVDWGFDKLRFIRNGLFLV